MSAYLYDTALISKIKNWTEKTDIHVYGPEQTRQLYEILADTNKDHPIELPIITIVRPGGYQIINVNKRPLTYDGSYIASDETNEIYAVQLNGIPIQLDYQLNVYARKYQEADAYMRELIFNLINSPKVEIKIPYYNLNILHESSIELSPTVEDLSSIPERLVPGQFTRLSVGFSIQDAYIWDTRIKNYLKLEGNLMIVSEDGEITNEELDLGNKKI